MIPLQEAFKILDEVAAKIRQLEYETIRVVDGLNRVLAETQYSLLDLPPFDKSAMDGYAILKEDALSEKVSQSLTILETVAAGKMARNNLRSGAAIKVMTGAPVPRGAYKVVPIECAEEQSGQVKFLTIPHASNICLRGEDVKCGDEVLAGGTFLNPAAIANLIACGVTSAPVYRKLSVIIISTGDEIVDDVQEIKIDNSKIMNSNGPMLHVLCSQYGLEVKENLKINDDYNLTTKTLKEALTKADIILFSGGVSAGDFDYVAKALNEVGLTIHFNRVAAKPGKPMTFASKVNVSGDKEQQKLKFVFGLPGNPVSVYIMFHLFVLRALRIIFGGGVSGKAAPSKVKYFELPLAKDFRRRRTERDEYVPCALTEQGDLMPLQFHGSAHLAVLLDCDGFFVVPVGVSLVKKGERLAFFPCNYSATG